MDICVDAWFTSVHRLLLLRGTIRRLERIDRLHRFTLGLHPHMAVVLQHLPGKMTSNGHQGLLGNAFLRQTGDVRTALTN